MSNHLYEYGLPTQCIQAATLANNQSIPGLFLDCHPVEALLRSRFECFYNSSTARN